MLQDEIKNSIPLSIFSKLPTDLINKSINDFQKPSDVSHLSQTNHFFNHALSKALQKKKEARKKEFYEAVSTQEKFFKNAYIYICNLIDTFLNKKLSRKHSTRCIEFVNLILAHAFDLDKKINTAKQSENEDSHTMFYIGYEQSHDRLVLTNLILSDADCYYLFETYERYYPDLNVILDLSKRLVYFFRFQKFLKRCFTRDFRFVS